MYYIIYKQAFCTFVNSYWLCEIASFSTKGSAEKFRSRILKDLNYKEVSKVLTEAK